MWVMTTRGFYSVVQHRDEPTKVMVRARCQDDINNLCELIVRDQRTDPFETPNADYPWRIVTTAVGWTSALTQMSLGIDYDNFKSAVKDDAHHDAYLGVWSVMRQLDDRYAPRGDAAFWDEAGWEDDEDEVVPFPQGSPPS